MNQQNMDTRATAYIFGELSETERAVFEQELRHSASLQAEVAEIREAVAALESEFHSAASDLEERHRAKIQRAIHGVPTPPPPAPLVEVAGERAYRRAMIVAVLTTCALLLVAFLVPSIRGDRDVALNGPAVNEEASELLRLVERFNQAVDAGDFEAAQSVATQVEQLQPDHPISRTLGLIAERDATSQPDDPSNVLDRVADPSHDESSKDLASAIPADAEVEDDASKLANQSQSTGQPMASLGPVDPLSGPVAGDTDELTGVGIDADAAAPIQIARDEYVRRRQRARQKPMEGMMGGMMEGGMSGEDLSYADMGDTEIGGGEMMAMGGMGMGMGGMGGMMAMEEMGDMEMDGMGMGDGTGMEGMGMGAMMSDMFLADEFGTAVPDGRWRQRGEVPMGDRFAKITENPFQASSQSPLSTFSIDVDTASYAKMRSQIHQGRIPNPNSIRIEELVNYFDYDYAEPKDEHPFAASLQVVECPWNQEHRLARIGIQGKRLDGDRPFSNLVFLLDVSGSMDEPNKLPLVIHGMKMLTDQLTENDRVAMVVYAGAAGIVLDSTRGDKKREIIAALDRLRAGGSTNGGEGIQLAYQIARDHFVAGGTNRVILCSDGDFNVGVTGTDELVKLAAEQAKSNIFLTVLGFGTGNHNDQMMEQVSNQANGNYAFVDGRAEVQKVLVEELAGTLVTIAKDVKIQVEFNPSRVAKYRLIGYENRVMAAADFADDKKDAGEIGAGHRVTALYEIVPNSDNASSDEPESDSIELRYQVPSRLSIHAATDELLTLKLRYKQPEGDESTLIEFPVVDQHGAFRQADRDFKLAAAVAGFGMLLRNSSHCGDLRLSTVEEIALEAARGDDFGYRTEFVDLVRKARQLRGE